MDKELKQFLDDGKFKGVSKKASRTMSAIRGKNNRTTELRLRMLLVRKSVKGWQLHVKELPGNPDFYFKKQRVAVFVDGCFWHGCPSCGHIPKTRSKFWRAKISHNKKRDTEKVKNLKEQGVTVLRIWEHEMKSQKDMARVAKKVLKSARCNQSQKKKLLLS